MHINKAYIKKILVDFILPDSFYKCDPQYIYIFNYHRIAADKAPPTAFFSGVYSTSATGFKEQLHWLKREFDFICEAQLLDVLHARKSTRSGKPLAMITFDDGYIDNFTVALPILQELQIPAIFFISTKIIEERKLGWWDLLAYLIQLSPQGQFRMRGMNLRARDGAPESIRAVIKLWKASSAVTADEFLAELAYETKTSWPSLERQSQELMTWEQVREARNCGIAIGSHAHSHTVFSQMTLAEQRIELSTSKAILERNVGFPVRTFAFPEGAYQDFHRESKQLVQECGYEAAFSFLTGLPNRNKMDAFDIPRIHPPATLASLQVACAFPKIYFSNKSAFSEPQPKEL